LVESKKPAPGRRQGTKLPQKAFRMPLLETVYELGGSAPTKQVHEIMAKKMAPQLSEADYALVSTGDERWWNAVCWERNDLVKERRIPR
jgi:restriction system protein